MTGTHILTFRSPVRFQNDDENTNDLVTDLKVSNPVADGVNGIITYDVDMGQEDIPGFAPMSNVLSVNPYIENPQSS